MTEAVIRKINHRMGKKSAFSIFVKYRYLYSMFSIVFLYYILFHYLPMYGVIIAFKDFNPFRGIWGSQWVGLKHFERAFTDKQFINVLSNTVLLSVYRIIFAFPVPIVFAILLNEIRIMRFKRSIQTVIYLPHFVSWVIMGGIILSFLSVNFGMINSVIKLLGFEPVFFLGKKSYFRPILIITSIIKEAGWGSIIYIAAITSINPELYQAAMVDGAGPLRKIWHITLPGIMPTIIMMLILSISNILSAGFEQVFVLNNDLVSEVGEIIDTYVYKVGIQQGRYSYTAAVGLFKSLVGLMLILGADRLSKKITDYGIM